MNVSGRIAVCLLLVGNQSNAGTLPFDDVSATAGIDHVSRSYGIAWGDFDGDGAPDFWSGNHFGNAPVLYRNNGDGTFTNIAPKVWSGNPQDDTHGAAWADFDNDGDQDLLELVGAGYGKSEGPNHLFINDKGVLTDRAAEFGIDMSLGRGRTPLWFDGNSDGRLDAVLVNMNRPDGKAPTTLFFQAEGHFAVANRRLGLASPAKPTLGRRLTNLGIRGARTVGWDSMEQRLRNSLLDNEGVICKSDSAFATLASVAATERVEVLVCNQRAQFYVMAAEFYRSDSTTLAPTRVSDVQDLAIGDFDSDGYSDIFAVRSEHWLSQVYRPSDSQLHAFLVAGDRQAKQIEFSTTGTLAISLGGDLDKRQVRFGEAGAGLPLPEMPGKVGLMFALGVDDEVVRGLPRAASEAENLVQIGYDYQRLRWQLRSTVKGLRVEIESSTPITNVIEDGFESSQGAMPDAMMYWRDGEFRTQDLRDLLIPTACFSVASADFDNDGDLDLYLACSAPAHNLPNIYYENMGSGRWHRYEHDTGAPGSSGSVAVADYDQDGFVDLLVTNGRGEYQGPLQLFRNRRNANHWIEIDLEGSESNRDGIGARLQVVAGGNSQFRVSSGGMHRYSQNHKRIHFGLGRHNVVDEIVVRWPSGIEQRIRSVPSDQVLTIVEPVR